METKTMDTKTKVFKAAIQVLLALSYMGYFISLYRGNDRNVSMYTNYIIVIVCLSGSLFVKTDRENKVLYVLTGLNGVIFVFWALAMVAQLIM
ncbi:hypothetical protein C823_006731 [Eubacterium plexicaudatum ASF492]|uniref:Uncharacterized protein n=1 Tax=Eubacterium plexicaudatum ASF492 TaxID=1235802 RepID=N2ACL2_9FIRM|nr:hypothetical protein C823_006731 [Eubacterium plexicaudatum ASF492]